MQTSWKEIDVAKSTKKKHGSSFRRELSSNEHSLPTITRGYAKNKKHSTNYSTPKIHTFPPKTDMVYSSNNQLTINIDNKPITRTIGEWMTHDVLSLARVKHQKNIELDAHLNRVLFERMRRIPNAHKKFLGLKLNVNFPGYNEPVPAGIPYKRYPVKFYNWWLENKSQITLSFKEKLELLNKVNMLDKKALLPEHRALMNR